MIKVVYVKECAKKENEKTISALAPELVFFTSFKYCDFFAPP